MKLKSPKELGITRTQFRNIARLCMFVKDKVPPPKFNMREYHSEVGEPKNATKETYTCGTSACFAGHGPLAGIRANKDESWYGYAVRAFGEGVYDLLFYDYHTNTRAAAVRRGAYYLVHGLPDCLDCDLGRWEAPKSFRPNWKLIAAAAA